MKEDVGVAGAGHGGHEDGSLKRESGEEVNGVRCGGQVYALDRRHAVER